MKHRLLKEVVRQLDRNCNCEQNQPYKLFCMIHLKKKAIQEINPFNNPSRMSPFATVRNVMKLQMELEEGAISEADFQKIADSLSKLRFGLWEDLNEAIDRLINKEYQAPRVFAEDNEQDDYYDHNYTTEVIRSLRGIDLSHGSSKLSELTHEENYDGTASNRDLAVGKENIANSGISKRPSRSIQSQELCQYIDNKHVVPKL